jgi:hypothetical protein
VERMRSEPAGRVANPMKPIAQSSIYAKAPSQGRWRFKMKVDGKRC